MDCHFLLQGIFPTQGSKLGFPHCRQMLYCLSHQGSPFLFPFPSNSTPDHFHKGENYVLKYICVYTYIYTYYIYTHIHTHTQNPKTSLLKTPEQSFMSLEVTWPSKAWHDLTLSSSVSSCSMYPPYLFCIPLIYSALATLAHQFF